MIGPKAKALTPGHPSNAHTPVNGVQRGEEVGGVDSVLSRDWHRHISLGDDNGLIGTGIGKWLDSSFFILLWATLWAGQTG